MRRTTTFAALFLMTACNTGRDEIDQIQTNIVDKSVFEGDWYYQETLIKLTGDNALFTGEFVGDNLNYDFGTYKGEGIPGTYEATENRIRWVIDKDVLTAFRSNELVDGGNVNALDGQWPFRVGTRVTRGSDTLTLDEAAAGLTDSGVDVGTQGTVVASSDTQATIQWDGLAGAGAARTVYERDVNEGIIDPIVPGAGFLGEPIAAFPILEHLDILESYNPVTGERGIIRTENTTDRRWFERRYMRVDWGTNIVSRVINFDGYSDEPASVLAEEGTVWPDRWDPQFVSRVDEEDPAPYADEFDVGEVYYMSFVTRRVRSPGYHCLMGHGPCSSLAYTVRSSFLKSSPRHDYRPLQEPGIMYDRFGIIRLGQPTYTRTEDDPVDGVGPDYGETDFVNYYATRHNLWKRHHDDRGNPLSEAELWAPDNIRGIHYMFSDRYPAWLVRPGLYVFLEWNKSFVDMVRRHNGEATPGGGGEPYDCEIVGGSGVAVEYPGSPEGSYPDTYEAFADDINLRMEGSECYVTGEVNPCDVNPEEACVELGDIRYHFFNLIPDPGPWFCGVSIPTADLRSGELISANINTTTQCLDNASTRFIDQIHALRDGILDDAGIISGEDIREYMAANGRVRYPHAMGPDGPLYNADHDGGNGKPSFGEPDPDDYAALVEALRERMETLRPLEGMPGRAQIFSDAMRSLEGTGLERDVLEAMGQDSVDLARTINPRAEIGPDAQVYDEVVADQISPFRGGGLITLFRNADPALNDWPIRPGRIYEPALDRAFTDPNIEAVIDTIPSSVDSDAKTAIWFKRRILLWVMLHELGHSLGMEHNFAGSIDKANYLDEWYPIDAENPLPKSEDYGLDTSPTAEDLQQYAADTRAVRDARDAAGIAMWQYTSVMDYMGLAERVTPRLGRYDNASVAWNYGGQVEIYDGDPRVGQDNFLIDPTSTPRSWVNHYQGGETCSTTVACPYADANQQIRQRCLENPRYERQPVLCGEGDQDCVCSSYENDVADAVQFGYDCDGDGRIRSGGEVIWDCDGNGSPDHWPVQYMTCGNLRLNDISWCNTFDRGSTFREVIENYRDSYNRYYVWRNFRRLDPLFQRWTPAYEIAGYIYDSVKIFQHLFYRYFYEEEFSARTGALGFWDQFLAAVDTLNWMNSILAQPDVGSYDLDQDANVLQMVSREPDGTGEYDLPMGPGKWIFSQNRGDEFGVFYTERAGILLDKMFALEALARREWGLGYTYDARFYFNFYDFFPTTMEQVFGGAVRGDVASTGALYDGADETAIFPNVWHGIGDLNGRPENCIDPEDQNPNGLPAIGDAEPLLIREYAAAWALTQFAVFYDTDFAQQMYIFVEGTGEGLAIPEVNPRTGEPLVEGVDYIRYTSETRGKTYVSLAVEPDLRYPGCAKQSISFEMLRDAIADQELLQELRDTLPEGDPAIERQRLKVANRDSLIELLIDMQRRFGISNWFV